MKTLSLLIVALMVVSGARAQTPEAAYMAAVEQSIERAAKTYPDALVMGSRLRSAIATEEARLRKAAPDFFIDTTWPERLTAAVAAKVQRAPAATPQVRALPRTFSSPAAQQAYVNGTLAEYQAESARQQEAANLLAEIEAQRRAIERLNQTIRSQQR